MSYENYPHQKKYDSGHSPKLLLSDLEKYNFSEAVNDALLFPEHLLDAELKERGLL